MESDDDPEATNEHYLDNSHPGPNEPSGFVLTTLLGIAGAFVATYLGQAIGWYHAGAGAGLIGAGASRSGWLLPSRVLQLACRLKFSSCNSSQTTVRLIG